MANVPVVSSRAFTKWEPGCASGTLNVKLKFPFVAIVNPDSMSSKVTTIGLGPKVEVGNPEP
jgi:hypothetical protein